MRKFIASMMVFVLLGLYSINAFAGDCFLDTSDISDGVVGVTYQNEDNIRYKVMISKGSEKYYYDYLGHGTEFYPLQFGDGDYNIRILKNISGTEYLVVHSETVHLDKSDENVVYLQSIQNVKYDYRMKAISKASELGYGLNNIEDRVKAIYWYIVTNIDYDYEKMNKLDNLYIPDIENTFESQKGICYDFSSLFASMLRSQGIPAKLVKGYSANIDGYHSWNEVFVNGKWIIIDTTYDAVFEESGEDNKMIKDNSDYQAQKYY